MGFETKKEEADHVNLRVLSQDSTVVQFKIKKHATMKKLMSAYCERTGLNVATVRFRIDGHAILESDTPATLNMEEGDTIEVFQPQLGGFGMTTYVKFIYHK